MRRVLRRSTAETTSDGTILSGGCSALTRWFASQNCLCTNGGAEGTRTPDPHTASVTGQGPGVSGLVHTCRSVGLFGIRRIRPDSSGLSRLATTMAPRSSTVDGHGMRLKHPQSIAYVCAAKPVLSCRYL